MKTNLEKERFLDVEKANALFVYEPDTGIIRWKIAVSTCVPAGTIAGGNNRSDGYVRIGVKGYRYLAHRLAWLLYYGEWPKEQIDHINRNKEDNRLCNLRAASHSDNVRNTSLYSNNTTGHKGVIKCGKKWGAVIYTTPVRWLGTFCTKEQAAEAYAAAARLHFGEFANPAKSDSVP